MGEAVANRDFVAAPAGFNAIATHGMRELHSVTGDALWLERAGALAMTIDDLLWDEGQGLWSDLALVGSGDSTAAPTLDGVLPALCTADEAKAARALDQCADRSRFSAPYGLAYVARSDELYRPGQYWRGAAWPQMNHLVRIAAERWSQTSLADEVAVMSRRAAMASGFAELWNPETGRACGAVPQTWAALAAVGRIDQPPPTRD